MISRRPCTNHAYMYPAHRMYRTLVFPHTMYRTRVDVKGRRTLLHLTYPGTLYGGILERGTFYERGTYMHDLCMV